MQSVIKVISVRTSPGLLPPGCLIRQETVLYIVRLHPGVKMGSPPKCLD